MRARSAPGRAAALLVLLALGAGCASLKAALAPRPQGAPGSRPGWMAWSVGGLRFEAPAGWAPSGDPLRLVLDADGAAQLRAWEVEERFTDGPACLAAAGEALARGEAQLSRVRRHTTTLAGRPAVVQEADDGGWHGWAYAVCHGGVQHRLFFTGRSPIAPDLLEAWRDVVASVRLGGTP